MTSQQWETWLPNSLDPDMPLALVIDDNRPMVDSLCEMLRLLGIEAQAAYGPRSAMLVLNEIVPDVVLLDINMPGVSGFEVLAFLRREPRLADVPVVVVTSDEQAETTRRALQAGAFQIIIKPVMLADLENTLRAAMIIKD